MEFKTGDLHRVLSICAEASPVPDAIGQTALFYAVQRPSDSEARGVADCLISVAGIDPSRKDFGGQSPLFYAAAVGNVETIKLLLGLGETLVGRLLAFDALEESFRAFKVRRDPQCPACGEDAKPIVIAEYDDLCMPHAG